MSMTVIEHIEVGSGGAASIEFTSISGDYTDLCLVCSIRLVSDVNESILISLNGSTSNFSGRYLQGNGSSAYSGTITRWIGSADDSANTANTFSNTQAYFPNYTSSANKSFSSDSVMENNASGAYQDLGAGLWSVTDAINSITISAAANLAQYSSATLYGITAGSDGTTTVS